MSRDRRQPKPGDLIEVKRLCYQHWALYLGDGYVIHVTSEDEGIPTLSASSEVVVTRKAKVKKHRLSRVVGTDDWEVNNKYDYILTPLPVKEIIKRAESYIDRKVPYRVFSKNCEHFVTMLRYGKEISEQADRGLYRLCSYTTKADTAAAVGLTIFATVCGLGPIAIAAGIGVTVTSAVISVFIDIRKPI